MICENPEQLTKPAVADAAPLIALALEWAEFPSQAHDDFAVCDACSHYYLEDWIAGVELRKYFISPQGTILCERCLPEGKDE